MTLKIIGSGFGRTGTRSLKEALEILGFGPCHHMEEVLANPPQVAHWQAVCDGLSPDWDKVFKGYQSQIDWPGAHVWQDLAGAFPGAKIIHSMRPDDSWWNSFSGTIGKLLTIYRDMPLPPHVHEMMEVAEDIVGHRTFGGRWAERDAALAAYHHRAEEVTATLPADRLLVFDVAQGWDPLCDFLGAAVPEVPFPHRNVKSEFWDVVGGEPA
ncbi:MAG: sulfotransferase [Thalassovita sp.]|nr:sulfotransferase [Thalassovita sp.]